MRGTATDSSTPCRLGSDAQRQPRHLGCMRSQPRRATVTSSGSKSDARRPRRRYTLAKPRSVSRGNLTRTRRSGRTGREQSRVPRVDSSHPVRVRTRSVPETNRVTARANRLAQLHAEPNGDFEHRAESLERREAWSAAAERFNEARHARTSVRPTDALVDVRTRDQATMSRRGRSITGSGCSTQS